MERLDKEQENEQGKDKQHQRSWDCAKPEGEQEEQREAQEQNQRAKKADALQYPLRFEVLSPQAAPMSVSSSSRMTASITVRTALWVRRRRYW